MWFVTDQQGTKEYLKLFLIIGDKKIYGTHIRFIVFLALINFLGILNSGEKKCTNHI